MYTNYTKLKEIIKTSNQDLDTILKENQWSRDDYNQTVKMVKLATKLKLTLHQEPARYPCDTITITYNDGTADYYY